MEESRKVKAVWIMPELLQEMLTTGNRIQVEVEKGLPDGAIYTRAYYDQLRGHIALIFYHPDFEPVTEGMIPEYIAVTLRDLNDA